LAEKLNILEEPTTIIGPADRGSSFLWIIGTYLANYPTSVPKEVGWGWGVPQPPHKSKFKRFCRNDRI